MLPSVKGGSRRRDSSCVIGSCGAKIGAKAAMKTSATAITRPIIASGLRRKRSHDR
jgi:hypothetical protein